MISFAPVIYLVLAGIAVVFLVAADGFPAALSARDIGPAAFPVWLAGAMLALIAVDLVISRHRMIRVPLSALGRAMAAAALLCATVWLAEQAGFFVILPLAVFSGLWLAGSRSWVANALFSLGLPAVIWLLFDRILMIPMSSL